MDESLIHFVNYFQKYSIGLLESKEIYKWYCQVVERRTNRTPEGSRLSSLGARHLRPCLKRFGTQRTIIDCPEQMTPKAKQIVALAVRAQKSLRMTVRTKASHLPFLLSGMFM